MNRHRDTAATEPKRKKAEKKRLCDPPVSFSFCLSFSVSAVSPWHK